MVAAPQVAQLQFRIHGLPAPQGSKRSLGNGIMVESSKRVRPWRNDVVSQTMDQYKGQPLTGPVEIEVVFWFPRPQAHYKIIGGQVSNVIKADRPTHTTSTADGDLDKILRSTFDSLSAKAGGCVIKDDSLVVCVSAEKRYVTDTEGVGALITVRQR